MTFNDIVQCIHLAVSSRFGVASLVIEEDKATSFMGGQIAPIHTVTADSIGCVPAQACDKLAECSEFVNLPIEELRQHTAIIRWGKVRYCDDSNVRISYILGVSFIKGGAL